MHRCLEAGRVIDVPCEDTLSDSTAGGVEAGSITFPLCQAVIDRSILVSEEEIADAMRAFIEHHHMLIEGAAGVAIASYLKMRSAYTGKRVVIVLCGANISAQKLQRVLAG